MALFHDIREFIACQLGLGGRMRTQRFRTMSGTMRVYEIEYDDGKPARVMNVRGTYQSATYLDDECYELVFGYHRAYNELFAARDFGLACNSVLMLGGGGFSYPKYLISHHPDIAVDVVEIDPAVVAVAHNWFYLDRLIAEFDLEETERLAVYEEDARAYLERPGRNYDVIVNDCFDGRIPVMSLATREAAKLIHERLNPKGLYVSNVISALRGSHAKLLHGVMNTLQQEFAHVHVLPGSESLPRLVDNWVVIATDGDYSFAHAVDLDIPSDAPVFVDEYIGDYECEFVLLDT